MRSISVCGPGRPRIKVAALGAFAVIDLLLAPAAAGAQKPTKVKVETRNLYLGADLTPAIGAPNPALPWRRRAISTVPCSTLTSRAARGLSAFLIGDDDTKRTNTGLWPSDHGGVVAKLKVG